MLEDRFPAAAGSYLLWCYLPRGQAMRIGSLGVHTFKRGWYLYCGSAFGPGGVRARLRHHLGESPRPHWHIDYLKPWASIRLIWLCRGLNLEHEWSWRLASLPRAERPVRGFGASDCRCCSHLVYLPKKPFSGELQQSLRGDWRIERFRLRSNF